MLCLTSVFFMIVLHGIFNAASEDPLKVNVKAGHTVSLKCLGPTHSPIEVVKWIRPDLRSDHYVYFYREKHSVKYYQHPLFVGRVELSDPQMKNGDVSVILKNVTINDTGRYECEVSVSSSGRIKRAPSKLFCSIDLKVDDPDAEESSSGLIPGVLQLEEHHLVYIAIAAVVVLIILLGIIFVAVKYLRDRSHSQ